MKMTRATPRSMGAFGLWTFSLDRQPWSRSKELAAEIEEMGWSAIWIPEATNRNVFVNATLLLGATKQIAIATGIAPIHNRDAMATVNGQRTLDEAFPDRFVLGLGVSHAWLVEDLRGGAYTKPLSTMRAYLDRMDAAPFSGYPPTASGRRLLAALGPKMLALAAEKADGAHPYLVTPDHTAKARSILGPGKILAPDQKVLVETDAAEARRIGRMHLSGYLAQPNYRNNFMRQGFALHELDNGGSDRLVDAVVAWGSLESVVARVRAHRDAGADHVAVQVLPREMGEVPLEQWRAVAAALAG